MSTESTIIPTRNLTPSEGQAALETVNTIPGASVTTIHAGIIGEEKRKAYLGKLADEFAAKRAAHDLAAHDLETERQRQLCLVSEWENLLRERDNIRNEVASLEGSRRHAQDFIDNAEANMEQWLQSGDAVQYSYAVNAAGEIGKSLHILKIIKRIADRKPAELAQALAKIEAFKKTHGITEQPVAGK